MKILVGDYEGFKRVVASLGTPSHVYYNRPNPLYQTIATALAVKGPDGFYVEGNNFMSAPDVGVQVPQFLLDFPGAIEALNVQGVY